MSKRKEATRELLYFAYGSNLNVEQMKRRCPQARLLCTATLTGFRFAFTGWSALWGGAVATIVKDETARVKGRLYSMTNEDFEALDRIEGHPHWYQRSGLCVRDAGGRFRHAQTYIAPVCEELYAGPSREYFTQLWTAYDALGFDVAPLLEAICPAVKRAKPVRTTQALRRTGSDR